MSLPGHRCGCKAGESASPSPLELLMLSALEFRSDSLSRSRFESACLLASACLWGWALGCWLGLALA